MNKMENVELKINLMKEQGIPHPPHGEEQEFYQMVASGDTQGILRLREKYGTEIRAGSAAVGVQSSPAGKEQEMSGNKQGMAAQNSDSVEKGRLSDNPLRNEIYHLVANCTIITRACISAGMPQEDAYSLSDMFIRRADRCKNIEEVRGVNDEMAMEFAGRMKRIKSRAVSPTVRRTISYISDNLHTKLTVEGIAEKIGYNRSYLAVIFRRETGQTITEFILNRRIEAAKSLISGGVALSEAAHLLGFSSQSHFCRCFRTVVGISPGEFRKENT